MKHAKILEENEHVFDWDAAKEASKNVKRKDGSVNWGAAACSDPGCVSCPNCGEYFWAEARLLQCTECDTKFNAVTKKEI